MALEAVVFQHDPFNYSCKEYFHTLEGGGGDGLGFEEEKAYFESSVDTNGFGFKYSSWDSSSPSSMIPSVHTTRKQGISNNGIWETNTSSSENPIEAEVGFFKGGLSSPAAATTSRRKRRRAKNVKNREEVENQRMTHITIERNRRKQMNDYLAVLRSMMPPPYVQRGDQASIVGGAINFVKELEQLLQSLEANKRIKLRSNAAFSPLFSDFFTFPQYTTHRKNSTADAAEEPIAGKRCDIADIEVTMVESHANLKILSKTQPKQLLNMVTGLQSLGLSIIHINVTTVEHMALYSFSVKVEDDCQLTTVNEIAAAVYDLVFRIQEKTIFS